MCTQFHTFHGHDEKSKGAPCERCGEHAGSASSMTNGDLCSDTPPANRHGAQGDGCITLRTSGDNVCGIVNANHDPATNGYGNIMSYVGLARRLCVRTHTHREWW